MTSVDFTMTQGDRLPAITATLTDDTGAAIDLTGCTVKFLMRAVGATVAKVDASASVLTPSAGTVQYLWAAADTDTPGDYTAEWEITYASTKKLTVPNGRPKLRIIVVDDIG